MKFLCVPCDSPMKMRATEESEPGSLAVIYTCDECGYEMAMLTNPSETQMVRSLGVRIGPAAAAAIAAPGLAAQGAVVPGGDDTPAAAPAAASKCPFSAMLGGGLPASQGEAEAVAAPSVAALSWTPQALARLDAIPEMVRPMARAGIEMVARENGQMVIDEAVLSEARSRFGM
jgi:Proto-chlorophyllide reductase 57 kD subunit